MYIREAFWNKVFAEAKDNKNVIFLTADYGDPKVFTNVGIAEQLMVNIATGLALCGKKVFCYAIDAFLVRRALDQIYNACCMKLPIVFVGSGVDRDYLADGATHWSCGNDVIMSEMPNIMYFTPQNNKQAIDAAERAMNTKYPFYVRLKR
uniref:Putative transketolase domain containing protein n=1 Tax=viral metagenome TaxID=1070528 RepID=A0A6M3LBC6_9ZZZZ